jgi:hypothetical protein
VHESSIAYAGAIQYLGAIQLAGTTTDVHKIMAALKKPDLFKLPLVKDNDPYEAEKVYPTAPSKGYLRCGIRQRGFFETLPG